MTFETFVQSDEKRHDMTKKIDKDKYKDKDILRTPPKSNPRDLTFETFVQSDEKT